jgi:uncharacterized protein YjdB
MKAVGLVAASLAFALAACDTARTNPQIASAGSCNDLIGVRVSPPSVTMLVGDSASLTATPGSCAPASFAVRWQSSNSAVVSVDSARGVVHALAAGQASVTAKEVADPAVSGSAAIQVNAR